MVLHMTAYEQGGIGGRELGPVGGVRNQSVRGPGYLGAGVVGEDWG